MPAAPPPQRSRGGCAQCRQSHRKCDEQRPACSRCVRAGRACDYALRLSWGGRPFGRSRFGDCLRRDPALVRLPLGSPPAFVYSSAGPPPVPQAPPAPFGGLPAPHRFLLHHFISCTTLALSCHPAIQRAYCAVLVPLAARTPHLLVALLSLAATHRASLGLSQSIAQLDALKAASLRCLQTALAHPASHQADAVIASILTLCTADIVSDGRSPGSWRSHLHGAAAVISHRLHTARGAGHPLAESTLLLWRWYLSIETITLLSGNVTISPGSRTALQLRRLIGHDAIDDLAGFSTALIPIFGDINLLAVESGLENSRQPAAHTDDTPGLPNGLIRERCLRMIENITSMLGSHEPRFRPNIDASLSSRHRVDFAAVDETYHHVALLHLYRRILNLPLSHHLVQASVHQIILRVSAIHFAKGPCPGVAVLQPLFAAGCEACNHVDRESVRALLSRLESQYGMGNVKKAKEFLEDLWAMRDDSEDVEGRVRWDTVMVEKGLDILPY
ncbi:hypothetical protein LOZ51_005686 [Ophidiomyces ophidiicola]|nr:hypothetical protein LOZ55_001479 [Ophidiomyces ophidiicola]KAI1987922.1 hypothetical protein LOZ51_005686 [Ophidiomyces ophidiicola]